jgi:hypothetical protein
VEYVLLKLSMEPSRLVNIELNDSNLCVLHYSVLIKLGQVCNFLVVDHGEVRGAKICFQIF